MLMGWDGEPDIWNCDRWDEKGGLGAGRRRTGRTRDGEGDGLLDAGASAVQRSSISASGLVGWDGSSSVVLLWRSRSLVREWERVTLLRWQFKT